MDRWGDDDDVRGEMPLAAFATLAVAALVFGLVIGWLSGDLTVGVLAALAVPLAAVLYRYVGRHEPQP